MKLTDKNITSALCDKKMVAREAWYSDDAEDYYRYIRYDEKMMSAIMEFNVDFGGDYTITSETYNLDVIDLLSNDWRVIDE